MPNQRITDLPLITTISDDDLFYIVDYVSNTSNKISYGTLVTSNISAFPIQISKLTSDVIYISGAVDINTGNIDFLSGAIDDAGGGVATDLTFLSSTIDVLSADVQTKVSDADIAGIETDILTLSSQIENIEEDSGDSIVKIISQSQGSLSAMRSSDATFELDLGVQTGDSPTFAAVTINGQAQVNSLRINQTATSTTTLTATHFVNVNISGTTYKMLLAT
tara:strand:- start:45 stop:707 length:663 start_codon:yes stop_codon:yes gene_type:complete